MNKYCIYKHTTPNGKVYIGCTKRKPEVRFGKGNSKLVKHQYKVYYDNSSISLND